MRGFKLRQTELPVSGVMRTRLLACWCVLLLLAPLASVWAHEGHDHGPALKPVDIPVLPRFEAQGEAMEVVGVLAGETLLLYLDRFDSNAPISGATLEIDSPQLKGVAMAREPGVYEIAATALQAPGKYPLALTVSSGDLTDLLAADLVVPAPVTGGAGTGVGSIAGGSWWSLLWLLVVGPVLWLGQRLIRIALPVVASRKGRGGQS